MKQINIKADSSSDATLTDSGLVSIEAVGHASQASTGDISMKATRYIQTTSNDWSTTTDANFDVKAAATEAAQIRFETSYAGSNINLKASDDMLFTSTGAMYLKATGNIEAQGDEIHLNGPTPSTAASASVTCLLYTSDAADE